MTRISLSTGDIWSEAIANAAVNPLIDGENNYGSIPLVRDENMDSDPTQLKARTYSYLNRMQLTEGVGRSLTYTQTWFITSSGNLILIPAGEITLAANVTGFVFISNTGNVQFSTVYPSEGDPLGLVATNSTEVIALSDLREQAIARSSVLRLPEVRSAFSPGDVKLSFSQNIDPGWLRCDGSFIDPIVQPNLFAAIGYRYGQSGSLFRLPLPGNKFLQAALEVSAIGETGGSNNLQLTANNLPRHTHGIFQRPHDHYQKDEKHTHEVIDYGHSHDITDPGHAHRAVNQRETNVFFDYLPGGGSEISQKGTGQFMPVDRRTTGISVQPKSTGIFLKAARGNGEIQRSSIDMKILEAGNGEAIEIAPEFIKVGILIKT